MHGGPGIKVEGFRIDIGQQGPRAGTQNCTDGSKKTEGSGDDRVTGADPCRGQRQPQGVGAGVAADSVGYTAFLGGGALKLTNLGAEDEILCRKDVFHGFEQERADGLIFARQIRPGNPGDLRDWD